MESAHHQEHQELMASVEKIETQLSLILSSNEEKKILDGLEILLKLMHNVLKDPRAEKFRTIKKTIPKIANTVFSLKGGIEELVLGIGYVATDAEHYVFVGDYFSLLKRSIAATEKALEPIRYKYMTEEEKKKYVILQEQKRLMREEQ